MLADALKIDAGPEGLRTAAQCQGRRENGEIFLAHTWFSSYIGAAGRAIGGNCGGFLGGDAGPRRAGIAALDAGNRIAAAAVSHEVRNLCSAIASVCSNLKERHRIVHDEDFQGLTTLVRGIGANRRLRPARTNPRHCGRSDAAGECWMICAL